MVASSYLLSTRSKENSIEDKWTSSFARIVHSIGKPISVRMTTSILKTREKDDSHVGFPNIVRQAQRTLRSSSSNLPLAFSIRFFRQPNVVLLVVLAWSLLCEKCGVEQKFLILRLVQNFQKMWLLNQMSLSTNAWRMSNLHIIVCHTKFHTLISLMVA